MKHSSSKGPTLPSVVQLGFSGTRELFIGVTSDTPQARALSAEVAAWLERRIPQMRKELFLHDNQFFVGISQLACGADTIFSEVCRSQQIPQRIFLPEYRERFLSAKEPNGPPDFTPRQQEETERLLSSQHIIQERVVDCSPDRSSRFEGTNIEMMRVSDVIICLIRADSTGRIGGTKQLMNRAIIRGIPVLELQVAENNGHAEMVVDRWHNVPDGPRSPIRNLPDDLAQLAFPPLISGKNPIPQRDEYFNALEKLAAPQAEGKQRLFKLAAGLIISTHIIATVLALSALVMHAPQSSAASDHAVGQAIDHAGSSGLHWLIIGILVVEFLFLAAGFRAHQMLHHSQAVREWAVARVVRELVRSLRAVGTRHLYLEYLFRLPLPQAYRPLLRTLSVMHLHSTRSQREQPWQTQRDQYVRQRFDDPVNGQLAFFERSLKRDERLLAKCQWIFTICSMIAMAATSCKIVLLWVHFDSDVGLALLGSLAVVLPVLAVGGLSWAAALDCEARVETFGETLQFIRRQRPFFEQAASGSEFDQLVIETETVLLGEITNWYSRRANKGVS
jgi:SMODS and SLOG-associating 2TM effector domain 1